MAIRLILSFESLRAVAKFVEFWNDSYDCPKRAAYREKEGVLFADATTYTLRTEGTAPENMRLSWPLEIYKEHDHGAS